MAKKGNRIRIIGGSYQKYGSGWMDALKKPTPKMFYIIVDMGDGKEQEARVYQSNVEELREPRNFEEAALQQNPDIEADMNKLARMLAKCGIQANNTKAPIHQIFSQKLKKANDLQVAAGHKATWRTVEWNEIEIADEDSM